MAIIRFRSRDRAMIIDPGVTAPQTDETDVFHQLVELVSTQFSWTLPPDEMTAETQLREDLDLDSLHIVELQVSIEDRFGVSFDPHDEGLLDAFTTIGSLASYVGYMLQRRN